MTNDRRFEIVLTIESTDAGVRTNSSITGGAWMSQSELNVLAIGALEIARASLLARRWGIPVGNKPAEKPLVEDPKPVAKPRKKK